MKPFLDAFVIYLFIVIIFFTVSQIKRIADALESIAEHDRKMMADKPMTWKDGEK